MAGLAGVASMFQPTIVSGNSMEPSLRNGKLVWVDRLHYRNHKPKRGEVVVFKQAGQVYVKRVYRTAGESIYTLEASMRTFTPIREGRQYEVAARFDQPGSPLHVRETRVPEDHVFVLGDNYMESVDSRTFGPVPIDAIIGRAYVPADKSFALRYEVVPPPLNKNRAAQPALDAVAKS